MLFKKLLQKACICGKWKNKCESVSNKRENVLSFLDNPKYVLILYAENQIKKPYKVINTKGPKLVYTRMSERFNGLQFRGAVV